jgi:hypothetical protein
MGRWRGGRVAEGVGRARAARESEDATLWNGIGEGMECLEVGLSRTD